MTEPEHMSSPGGTVYTLKTGTGKFGYEGVFEPHKGKGYHAKLRLDPDSKDQTTLPGAACQTPEEAALRLARFVAKPVPIVKKERAAKGAGERSNKKVRQPLPHVRASRLIMS
jgi:hypothetical protein